MGDIAKNRVKAIESFTGASKGTLLGRLTPDVLPVVYSYFRPSTTSPTNQPSVLFSHASIEKELHISMDFWQEWSE